MGMIIGAVIISVMSIGLIKLYKTNVALEKELHITDRNREIMLMR